MQPAPLVQAVQPTVVEEHKLKSYASPLRTTHTNTGHTSSHHADASTKTQPQHAPAAAQGPIQNNILLYLQSEYLHHAATTNPPPDASQAPPGLGHAE